MISVLANIGGYLAGIGAVVAVAMIENKVLGIALCVILAALALFLKLIKIRRHIIQY